jgi:hypothetical protein
MFYFPYWSVQAWTSFASYMQQTTEFTDRAEADGVPDGRPEGFGFTWISHGCTKIPDRLIDSCLQFSIVKPACRLSRGALHLIGNSLRNLALTNSGAEPAIESPDAQGG